MSWFRKQSYNWKYRGKPPWDTGQSPPELFAFIQHHPPGRALDIGCGTGTNVITLAQSGWQVWGIDFAPRAIAKARQKVTRIGADVHLAVDDAIHPTSLLGKFDLILDIGCFHSIPHQEMIAYLTTIKRFLAPGGTFLVYAFLRQSQEKGRGFSSDDLLVIEKYLSLSRRQDGMERGLGPSAWLEYSG